MPSRRRTRRAQPLKGEYRLSRPKPARQRKKIKKPQKPRFIRRYIRQKERYSKSQLKHSIFSNFGQPDRDKAIKNPDSNPGLKPFKYAPHDIAPADRKTQPNGEHVVGVTSVPNPTPDTGLSPATSVTIAAGSPLLGAIIDTSTAGLIVPATTALSVPLTKVLPVSFSPLPPLPSLVSSGSSVESGKTFSSSFPSPVGTGPPKTPNDTSQSAASKTHSINLALIILLGVGSALLLLGSCILIKMCTRPRRQERPKPSLPIFEDADPEDDFFEAKESPIFGGKERFSPMPGPGGPTWTWVQYPHAKLTQPALAATMSNDANRGRLFSDSQNSQTEFSMGPSPSQPPPPPPPLAPATSYHTVRRQSMTAASMYSPRSYSNIGQAITNDHRELTYTADGQDTQKRTKSKSIPKRRSQLGREDKQRNRESTVSTIGLAYDGEDVGSPGAIDYTPVDKVSANNHEGRERIKSGYFATGAYPRISTMPSATYSIATATRVNVSQRNSFNKDKFVSQNSTPKRQRDAQALTYALGLATPETNYMVQSPQPTLYPDDSMSIVDTKRHNRKSANFDSAPDVPVIVPDMPQNSGLMAMDFRVSQMSLSELTVGQIAADDPAEELHQRDHSRMEPQPSSNTGLPQKIATDQPPRVPSPPPLLSLAQMSLAKYNPETYANYRSPTYSLYGLYEKP